MSLVAKWLFVKSSQVMALNKNERKSVLFSITTSYATARFM